jgi:hypothetical protein
MGTCLLFGLSKQKKRKYFIKNKEYLQSYWKVVNWEFANTVFENTLQNLKDN